MGSETIGKQIGTLAPGKRCEAGGGCRLCRSQRSSRIKMGKRRRTRCRVLPKIADFFSVSIDSLFGRKIRDYGDIQSALMKEIAEAPEDDKVKTAFGVCWNIERALVSQNEYKSEERNHRIREENRRKETEIFERDV